MGESNKSLWQRLKSFTKDLDLTPEDEEIFNTEAGMATNAYINESCKLIVSVGAHLARVRKVKSKLESKLQKLFDDEYIKVTNDCLAGGGSSKFDVTYRTGKAKQVANYRETSELIRDITELEGTLAAQKDALHVKSMMLPSMFKLDKQQYYY